MSGDCTFYVKVVRKYVHKKRINILQDIITIIKNNAQI